jgi:pyrimidine deaminase RibD-like protein
LYVFAFVHECFSLVFLPARDASLPNIVGADHLEPCAMCAGAMVLARIRKLVYGATDPKAGAVGSLYNIAQDPRLNHRIDVTQGVLADESSELLKAFFKTKRPGTAQI